MNICFSTHAPLELLPSVNTVTCVQVELLNVSSLMFGLTTRHWQLRKGKFKELLIAFKTEAAVYLKAEEPLSSITQKKTALGVKRNPEEGFQRKQKDLSSFLFSSWLKSDSESPIRAAGLQNSSNIKEWSLTTVCADGFDWDTRRHKHAAVGMRSCPLPVCLCSLKPLFLKLGSIQPPLKWVLCLLCLVDDFGGELMKGGAETRKQQMKRNKHQTQLWDADYCWGRSVCSYVCEHWKFS